MKSAPISLKSAQVSEHLQHIDVVQEMRELFTELGQGKAVQPPQSVTLLPDDKGDFITYLGALAGAGIFGAKLSPYLVKDGPPVITAWTMLMSMETGQPLLLCDSGSLTTERTAATTALAVDFLAVKPASCLAIVGAGAVAQAHWRHVQNLRSWQEVRVYSRGLASNTEKQATWRQLCPNVVFSDSAEDAACDADTVLLCTSSGTPVIDAVALKQNALVTSISTNVPQAHEIAPEFLKRAQVYCDYRATTPFAAGEMVLAANNHNWNVEEIRGDLGELSIETCALPESDCPVFFRSVGLGLEDIAIANAIYRAASV